MIDAHAHLWDTASLHYPWLEVETELPRTVTATELASVAPDLDGVVLVEGDVEVPAAAAEVEWLSAQADALPYEAVIVAQCRLDDPVDLTARVRALADHPRVRGVRQGLQLRPDGALATGEMMAGVDTAAAAGLPVDICIRFGQFEEFTAVATACPDATIVLDHLGKPPIRQGSFDAWRRAIGAAAVRPNVHVKLSGLTTEADPSGWREEDLRPYLVAALHLFGANRCLFGSDWPVAAPTTTYPRWQALVHDALGAASDAERALVLDGNARSLYRLGGPVRSTSPASAA